MTETKTKKVGVRIREFRGKVATEKYWLQGSESDKEGNKTPEWVAVPGEVYQVTEAHAKKLIKEGFFEAA